MKDSTRKAIIGWGLLLLLVWGAFALEGGGAPGRSGVAVVPVQGIIAQGVSPRLGADSRLLARILDEAAANPRVVGVLLDVNSPGGTVGGSEELYLAVRRFRDSGKPIHAFVGEMGASGAYWVAAGAGRIGALSTSVVGSIGVIWSGLNWSGLMEKAGVADQTLTAGEWKDTGSTTRPMTAEEERKLQSLLDEAHDSFIAGVAAGRGMDEAEVRELADGWVYSGSVAAGNGLLDVVVSSYGEAFDAVCAAGGLEAGCPALDLIPEPPWYEDFLASGGVDPLAEALSLVARGSRPLAVFGPALPW